MLTFSMQINIKAFYKVILSLLMGMMKLSQSTQSNNFAISLKYLKIGVTKGVHFLHVKKYQKYYIIVFGENGQTCSKYPN